MSESGGGRENLDEFPIWGLQPKKETELKDFNVKYPEYDGRGTIIAILDSGVDPGARGLATTTDGKRKIIDRIDASGAGDVDTSKIVTPAGSENGDNKLTIVGATGRNLLLPSDIKNPSGKFRVGCKRVFDLYPKDLKERILRRRVEKIWDPNHKNVIGTHVRKKVIINEEMKDTPKDEAAASEDVKVATKKKLEKENADVEVEILGNLDKKFKDGGDTGPIFDIVTYHDGDSWITLIDTSETGDLRSHCLKLRPFRESGDFAHLTEDDQLNISTNIYDEGNITQIVSMCSSHGTHVAAMAAAHFPDEPHLNGTAPGAQIVSLTIGDARLSAMETGTTLVRAMTHIMQATHYKVDLINMSYGEFGHWSNTGRVGNLIGEVINKHGVIYCVSAGNDGPALTTVGTPPDISTNTAIGVGAYVSPDMMTALYSQREKLGGRPYTWSSRGPTMDGDRGVCICAPGGAITSVPNYTLKCTQLKNGTSMACPHTCGAIASLVSGLKAQKVGYSPFNVKRALANSAQFLPQNCKFGQGNGLLQIGKAFDYCVTYADSMDRNVRFAITVGASNKGIYLRGPEANKANEFTVKVDPIFLDQDNVNPQDKINFNMKFAINCDNGGSNWISVPSHLDLMYVARHFVVQVDPRYLEPGVHTSYIRAYNADKIQQGTIFEVPVTVVKPFPLLDEPFPHYFEKDVKFAPGTIKRLFLNAPEKSTWAVIKVLNSNSNQGKFVIHTVQIIPKSNVKTMSTNKVFTLSENGEFAHSIAVTGGVIIEICIAKWWANLGDVQVNLDVKFHGINPKYNEITMHGGEGIHRINIESPLRDEEIQPEIKLKNLVQVVRPNESKINVLGERDIIPDNRWIYELQLSYNFSIARTSDITPNLTMMTPVLYESEYESQLWMLYDSNKQLISCGDAFPNEWTCKVDKGDYVLKAHIRHEKKEYLEKHGDMNLLLTSKLSSTASLDVYSSFANASIGAKKCNSFTLSPGRVFPLYISPLINDKYTKSSNGIGQYLSGTMTLAKDDIGKKVDTYNFKYILIDTPNKKDKKNNSDSSTSKKKIPDMDEYKDSIKDVKINWLSKFDVNKEEHSKLYQECIKEYTDYNLIQIKFAHLQALINDKNFDKFNDEIYQVSNEILDSVKKDEILISMGTKINNHPNAAEITKENDKKRNIYLESLAAKGIVCLSQDKLEEADDILLEMMKFVDVNVESRTMNFVIKHADKNGYYGKALKLLMKQFEDKPNIENDKKISEMFGKLKWNHLKDLSIKSLPIRFPESYQLF